MRDTDCDLTSLIVVKSDSGIADIADLKGKTIAVGAIDSPQATLVPLSYLGSCGLIPGVDFEFSITIYSAASTATISAAGEKPHEL